MSILLNSSRRTAEEIFRAGVNSVLPVNIIKNVMSLEADILKIGDQIFPLEGFKNIYVIGAGKASPMMAREVEQILGTHITDGHIVAKYGYSCPLNYISVTEAGHPIPDSNGLKATSEILRIADRAEENDLVICLISGGGSSLLADLPEGCSLDDIMKLNELLVNCGASISEINAVRKHLSFVKGGQLARNVYPASLMNLMLSDVPGNNAEVIASGPTVPDSTTFSKALTVLSDYDLRGKISSAVIRYLEEGASGIIPETPKEGDPVFEKTYNFLVGSNRMALEAAAMKSLEYNINAVIVDDQLQGDVYSIAEYIVETSLEFQRNEYEIKPVCLLFGGETTLRMTGKGKGGRNQHLALLTGKLLQPFKGITVLCAGTDGNDGPTDAAGAVVDSDTFPEAYRLKTDPEKYLADFDSYNFFRQTGGQLFTGPTFTNVMDIIVVIVE